MALSNLRKCANPYFIYNQSSAIKIKIGPQGYIFQTHAHHKWMSTRIQRPDTFSITALKINPSADIWWQSRSQQQGKQRHQGCIFQDGRGLHEKLAQSLCLGGFLTSGEHGWIFRLRWPVWFIRSFHSKWLNYFLQETLSILSEQLGEGFQDRGAMDKF